jgi:predicted SAM-dependent methyltransferase
MDILNLGAGNKLVKGAVNHDLTVHRPEISVAWDLNNLPWPWGDNSFDMIVACAVLEHLRINLVESVNECWRILRPGGVLHVKLPYWNSDNSYRDPTHYWRFDLRTCDLFDPDTRYGRDYAFYTERKWRIARKEGARLNKAGTSFSLKMRVRK